MIAYFTYLLSLCYIVLRYTLRPRLSLEAWISPPIPSADNRPGARNPERWFINTPLQTNNPCTDVRGTNKSVCPLDNKNRLRAKRRRGDRVQTTVIAITQCTLRKTCAEPWHQNKKGVIIIIIKIRQRVKRKRDLRGFIMQLPFRHPTCTKCMGCLTGREWSIQNRKRICCRRLRHENKLDETQPVSLKKIR